MFTTPKLLESLAEELENRGTSIKAAGITGIFAGGTEFTPQYTRFAMEELLGEGVYLTPTYGNTLMGLACSKPVTPEDGYKITYYAPQPRAVIEVVSFDDPDRVVDYGETGRVRLTTLTRETFIPGFLERDEGEREQPYEKYPWDGVSGVRPFRQVRRAQRPWEFTDHFGEEPMAILNMPILRWGQPYTSLETDDVVHFRHRRNAGASEPGQHRPARPRHAAGAARARGADRDSDLGTDRDDEEGGGSLSERRPCRWATASRRRTISRASSRPAPACRSTCARPT